MQYLALLFALGQWHVDAGQSTLVVHVSKKGLFSPALHDHDFVPTRWQARLSFDPAHAEQAHVEISVATGSLQDQQKELSAEDRQTVENQTRSPQILDAARYPEIKFVADHFEPSPKQNVAGGVLDGNLVGQLSLHGRTQPLRVPVHARVENDRLHAEGKVVFNQSAFGIKPYSRAAGTIAVEDRVEVRFRIEAAR